MKILMVSSEVSPFAKTGGLADAVSALSLALAANGHEVKILLPRYYSINRDSLELCKKSVLVNTGWSEIPVDFYSCGTNPKFYFLDYEKLFGREGIYGSEFEPDYPDNPLRFSLLARAAFELCRLIDFEPDIIHSHDWSGSMVPVILKYFEHRNFPDTKSVLTIHNMGYQGRYPYAAFRLLGLPEQFFNSAHFDYYGNINFLQAGILAADQVNTVSVSYSKEIQTQQGGFGLDGLMRSLGDHLKGIVNGADLTLWNPLKDTYIPEHYSASDLSGKAKCKEALQEYFGFPKNPDIPIVGMIGRLADQKGIHEVFEPVYGCMPRLCIETNAQFVVVGSGAPWCQDEIRSLSNRYPNFRSFVGYNEEISHLVEAGSDYFLMPSRYEPCGLNQIYSMIYGTLPIVHSTGGLSDTVENFNPETKTGTGFKFYDYSPEIILNTTKWALSYFNDKETIRSLQLSGMKKDFSWKKSAEAYVQMYKNLLGKS